jgi:hypothetical protein
MNIELPDTITIPLGRNASYGTRDVSVSAFTNETHLFVYNYGLRQYANDGMAFKKDENGNDLPPDQIVAKADKRLDSLMNGTVRQRAGGSAEPLDPVEAEAWKIAKHELGAMVKDVKVTGLKGDAALLARINVSRTTRRLEEFAELPNAIEAYLAGPKGADVMRRAKRNVAERAKAVDMAEAGI